MNILFALSVTVLLSMLHLLGGGAVGRGLRPDTQMPPSGRIFFLALGGGFGVLPLVFDWFFLIYQGYPLLGLVGPSLFIGAVLFGLFNQRRVDGPAVIVAVLGSGAVLLGIFAILLLLNAAQTRPLGTNDYVAGGGAFFFFVFIGGSMALNGWRAIFRGVSLDQVQQEQIKKSQQALGQAPDADRPKD